MTKVSNIDMTGAKGFCVWIFFLDLDVQYSNPPAQRPPKDRLKRDIAVYVSPKILSR